MDEKNENTESLAPRDTAQPAEGPAPILDSPKTLAEEEAFTTPPVGPPIDKDEDSVIRLRKKHALATRWMHWINFPLLGIICRVGP